MSFDTNNLPISGGVIIATALYATTCLFITGPLVAERTIEKADWNGQCHSALHAEVEAQRAPRQVIPKMDCRSTIGAFLPSLAQLCDHYGNPDFGGPANALLKEKARLQREAEAKRLALAAAQSQSQCDCAANMVAKDRAWAIHAGSLRLASPSTVSNLASTLSQALHSPHCDNGRK